jgi:nickel/cobalt transporter (NicO) family protein
VNRRTAGAALATLVAGAALALLPAQAAEAHPLGNFSINQYDGLVAAPGELRVDHVEDLAEIPAAQAQSRIDTDGNDRLVSAELSAWARTRCDTAAKGARLVAGGEKTVSVSAGSAKAQVRPGQAGLHTLRVSCALTAALPGDGGMSLSYRPADVATGAGWREITARGDRMTVSGSDVPQDSVSRRLTAYPRDLLSSPPDLASAAFTVHSGGPALAGSPADGGTSGSPTGGVLPRGADRWAQALTGLVARHELTVGFAALALGLSVLLGALHALAPGHGKTMMAAAATAGGRSSLRDVLALGASVTLTHTLGVFGLGALITAGSAAAPTVVFWLGMASGTLVMVAGVLLLRRAWRQRRHGHGHGHGHSHDHGHQHPHGNTHGNTHGHDDHADAEPAHDGERVPALTAAHVHEQDHGRGLALTGGHRTARTAEHGGATAHEHHQGRSKGRETGPDHDHGHEHGHSHEHGHTHSHLPPAPGLRGVILLGFAGGLVPSPSAVVVLVGAAALGQAWFGFLLVLAYGAGLALTLAGAGFAVVRLRETTTRRLTQRPRGRFLSKVHRAAPLASAAVVFALGCGLLLRGALTGTG